MNLEIHLSNSDDLIDQFGEVKAQELLDKVGELTLKDINANKWRKPGYVTMVDIVEFEGVKTEAIACFTFNFRLNHMLNFTYNGTAN